MNWKYNIPKFEYNKEFNDAGLHWTGHRHFVYDLVQNMQPGIIVELGTWKGTSFFSMCQAIKDKKVDSKIFAVDTWEGDLHMGKFDDSIYKEVESATERYYDSVDYSLLKMTFDAAVERFENESIDVLHIDGLHTYEAVKHDFEKWLTKVSKNGIVLFHDIAVKKEDFGVYKFWQELKSSKKYATIEFMHSFGLGVLFKDEKVGEQFIEIQKELQMHYSLIHEEGKNFEIESLSVDIQKKEQEFQQKNHEIEQKNRELLQKDQEIQRKEQMLQHTDQVLQQREQVLQQKEQILQQKDQMLKQKDQMLKQKDQMLKQKDQEINMIKSSKFWKLRGYYLKIKLLVLSPMKYIRKKVSGKTK